MTTANEKIAERLAQYTQLTENITKLEGAIEQVKAMRSDVAKALREENGKDQLYDLGDGIPLFVSATKIGTFFLAPKRRSGTRKKKKKVKKEIKDGKVVEVGEEGPAPTKKPIEIEATLTGRGAVAAPEPEASHTADTVVPAPSEPPPEPEPVVTPPPEPEGTPIEIDRYEEEEPLPNVDDLPPPVNAEELAAMEPDVVEPSPMDKLIAEAGADLPPDDPEPVEDVAEPSAASEDEELEEFDPVMAALAEIEEEGK